MDKEFHRILDGITERWAGAFRAMAEWRQDEPAPYACNLADCTELAVRDGLCERHLEVD